MEVGVLALSTDFTLSLLALNASPRLTCGLASRTLAALAFANRVRGDFRATRTPANLDNRVPIPTPAFAQIADRNGP